MKRTPRTIQKISKYRGWCALIVCPAVHFYLLEAYTHNGFLEVRPWSQVFNIMLFELAAWILFLVFHSVKEALLTEGICAMALGLANYYVYTFRSLPLVPWDLLSAGTAASVAGNYDFTPTPRILAVAAGFLFVFVLEGFCKIDTKEWKRRYSLPAALALCVGLGAFAGTLQQEDFQNSHRMYNKLFTPVFMWQVNGFALTMVMELPYLAVEKPSGYQKDEAKELLTSYETDESEDDIRPNIIVIMDEAFSDLGVLGEFTPTEDYMPFFHEMTKEGAAENIRTGALFVSVCGGNTANTEFEFLTGNTMAFLPQGSIPYQQYIKKEIPALPSYLRTIGYETYAMHPYYSSGWDRDTVYPLLGFSHLEFIGDYRNKQYIREYVSDRSCVDKIIDTYEQKAADQPMFLFNVTMQNHGAYSTVYENFKPDIEVEGTSSYALSTYLSLIKRTDEALEALISYFAKETEPVMIVFFGDHQPNDTVAEPILRQNGMSSRTLSGEQLKLRYQVPYLIWANFEPKDGKGQQVYQEDTSVNYLGAKVLEAAGLTLPAYQSFLDKLSDRYPVISAVSDLSSKEVSADMQEYKKMQYYQLFDIQK